MADETRTRYAMIQVKVPLAWLAADGEMSEESGWEELASQLKHDLKRSPWDDVQIAWDGWQEVPDA